MLTINYIWKNDAALPDEISMLLKAGDARNEKEQGGGGRALFLSSVLARTATLDLTNFSALTSLAKSLSRKLIYIKQNHFYFILHHYLTPQHLLHWSNNEWHHLSLFLMVRVFLLQVSLQSGNHINCKNYLYCYNLQFRAVIRALKCAALLAYFKETENWMKQTNDASSASLWQIF